MNRRQKTKKKKKTAEETPPPPPNEPRNAHSGGEDFLLPPPRDFSAIQLAHRSVRLPSLFIALSLSLPLHVRVVYELCTTTTTATTTSSRNTNSILDFVLIVVHNSSFFTAGESDLSQPPSHSAQAVIRQIAPSEFCSFSYSVIHSLPCVVLSVLTHSLSFCSITTDFRYWPLFCCCCDCGANLMRYSVRVLSSSSQAIEAISSTATWIVASASHTYTFDCSPINLPILPFIYLPVICKL